MAMMRVNENGSTEELEPYVEDTLRRYIEVKLQVLAVAEGANNASEKIAAAISAYAKDPYTREGCWYQGEWFHHEGVSIRAFYEQDWRVNGEMAKRRRSIWEILGTAFKRVLLAGMFVSNAVFADPVVPTQNENKFSVELRLVTEKEAFDYCKAEGAWPGLTVRPMNKAMGCTAYYREEKRCVIVTPMPQENGDDAMLNLGHEVLHCSLGSYHH